MQRFEAWCSAQVEPAVRAQDGNAIPANEQARDAEVNNIKLLEIEKSLDDNATEWLRWVKSSHRNDNEGQGPTWTDIRTAILNNIPEFKKNLASPEIGRWTESIHPTKWFYRCLRNYQENTSYRWPEIQKRILADLPWEFQNHVAPTMRPEDFPTSLMTG